MSRRCTAIRVRRLNRVVTALYDEELRSLGVRASQLNLLVAIGARKSGIRAGELSEALCLDKSTLSRNIDRLQEHGWIRARQRHGSGRRWILTARGRRLLVAAEAPWRTAQRRTRALLGPGTVAALDETASGLRD